MTTIVDGIDHVILGVQNLAAAADSFGSLLGLHVSGGGIHPSFGTANRIIVLEDDYIELIAAQEGAQPHGFIGDMLTPGLEGWIGFALQTPNAGKAAAALQQRGIPILGPAAGRLESGDGFSRGWHTVRFAEPPLPGLPFLIQHQSSGQERRRLLAGTVGLAPHPLGAEYIDCLTIAVPDLAEAMRCYTQLLDLQPEAPAADAMLAADTVSLQLPRRARLMLAAPSRAGDGPVARVLNSRGPGLMAITLAVTDLARAVQTLRGRGLGVRVEEPGGVLVAAQLHHQQLHGARIALVQAAPASA